MSNYHLPVMRCETLSIVPKSLTIKDTIDIHRLYFHMVQDTIHIFHFYVPSMVFLTMKYIHLWYHMSRYFLRKITWIVYTSVTHIYPPNHRNDPNS